MPGTRALAAALTLAAASMGLMAGGVAYAGPAAKTTQTQTVGYKEHDAADKTLNDAMNAVNASVQAKNEADAAAAAQQAQAAADAAAQASQATQQQYGKRTPQYNSSGWRGSGATQGNPPAYNPPAPAPDYTPTPPTSHEYYPIHDIHGNCIAFCG